MEVGYTGLASLQCRVAPAALQVLLRASLRAPAEDRQPEPEEALPPPPEEEAVVLRWPRHRLSLRFRCGASEGWCPCVWCCSVRERERHRCSVRCRFYQKLPPLRCL